MQLVLTILDDPDLSGSNILIVDKSDKDQNDRTWSFWEKGKGPYDEIIYKSWPKGWFHSSQNSISLEMGGYVYKTLRAIDFYTHAKKVISGRENITWLKHEVNAIGKDGVMSINEKEYTGKWIFDSRVSPDFEADTKSVKLLQHFLGWIVEFEEDVFDEQCFTMMDFRYKMPETCSFIYVLPFNPRKALIEFTFFNDSLIEESEYEDYIKSYLESSYEGLKYTIVEKEFGIIPMTTYKFHKAHQDKVIKIGTAGGWVKPSSGYSFKISQRFISMLLKNIKSGRRPEHGIGTGKNRFYDSIFLGILKDQNYRGEALFDNMYSKLPADLIFKFLDEETKLGEDIRIMSKFTNLTFTKAFFKQLFA